MAFRAFVAVDVGPKPKLRRLSEELAQPRSALKMVDPETFHLTLKFLGDIGEDRVPEVTDAMERAAADVEPFTARFRGVGAFPDEDFIKVVWAGMDGGEPLEEIAASLESDLGHIRQANHEFSPHLTLARMRGAQGKAFVQDFLDQHRDDQLDELHVDAVELKRSDLRPDGPVYSTVEEVRLDG